MSDELKPCPFCGAGAARGVGNASFSGVELMGAGTDRPYVWCGTCGSAGSFEDTNAKAVAAWNTRTDLADALAAAASSLMDMAMWTESAEDTEMVIVSVGTVRRIRTALAAYEARK